MMNRITQYLNSGPAPASPTDYWWIETRQDVYVVSRGTARAIERRLDGPVLPRWIVFRDLTGARHRILASAVRSVSESTAAQRQAARAFQRALREEKEDGRNPWDDGDRS
jgi:hypothetical protein